MARTLGEHKCVSCPLFVSLFTKRTDNLTNAQKCQSHRNKIRQQQQYAIKQDHLDDVTQQADQDGSSTSSNIFPPDIPSAQLITDVINGFHSDMNENRFVELPCAVCALLTSVTQLALLDECNIDLSLLKSADQPITRKERFSADDAIEECEGPIILPNCNHICADCLDCLQKRKIPVNALAVKWLRCS